MNLSFRKIKFFIRDYWSALLTLISLGIIIFLISASYKTYKLTADELAILREEVKLLKNRVDTLKFNKTLTEEELGIYNKILTYLIPEKEDFFSMIYAIETISEKTNFTIASYTILFSKSTPNKISINVEGRGNIDQFLDFLKNYKYAGGRLITSEKIEYSGVATAVTRIGLNFYNQKYSFNQTVIPHLSKKDVEKLETIKNKIQISFKDQTDNTNQEYETSSNPF